MPNLRTRFSQSPDDQRIRVKLFGIGSAGCNMIDGAPFPTVAVSSSSADLARCRSERKLLIGQDRLLGLSDSGPELVKQVPTLVGHELLDIFNNTDVAFLMCGLGGFTGSMGTRILSSVAKARSSLGIVLAATPFSAESLRRREMAQQAISSIARTSPVCIEFPNDELSSLAPNLPLSRAFSIMNAIMMRPVMDLCGAMSRTDIASFRQVLGESARGRFGLGLARGDDRVEKAVHDALTSPWFDFSLGDATAAIVVYSAADPWDREADRILSLMESQMPSARIVWGSYPDISLGERIRISVVLCRNLSG